MKYNFIMIIHPFTSTDLPHVEALQQKYAQAYPGASVHPGGLYFSPAFHGGQDVFCAYEGDRLLAYAPLYLQIVEQGPAKLPHIAWVEIKADPDLPDPRPVKDALYACLRSRMLELTESHKDRPLRMCFEYMPGETEAVAYVQSKGFAYTESVFGMCRDLTAPILDVNPPEGIYLRQWKMESETEQVAYVTAKNECFPEAPVALSEWQYFLSSPMWAVGTSIAAFDGSELVGNVSVYWSDDEIAQSGVKAGYTEYIFVRPAWRGRGIAQAMITEGMRYLKSHGIEQARLEVRAFNEGALGVYKKLGYQVARETRFYALLLA